MFIAIHPEGIEPPSQEPESYVISITLRVETLIIISKIGVLLKTKTNIKRGRKKDLDKSKSFYIFSFFQEVL